MGRPVVIVMVVFGRVLGVVKVLVGFSSGDRAMRGSGRGHVWS